MGPTLYGYKWNKNTGAFEVVEEEAKVVRLIYRWYTQDNLGMGQRSWLSLLSSDKSLTTFRIDSQRETLHVWHHISCEAQHNPPLNKPARSLFQVLQVSRY